MSCALKKNEAYLIINNDPFRQMTKQMKGLHAIMVKTELDIAYLNSYIQKPARESSNATISII